MFGLQSTQLLPAAIVVLQLGAAMVYASKGQWNALLYWAGACVVNFAALRMAS